MINTQTQIDSLIDLAVIQRAELKQLVESLPQLRDHLSSEIERNLEEIEPAIRSELEQFVAARALDTQAKTSAELGAKLDAMARNLESTTAAKYSVLMVERAQNATLLAQAEARIAEAASALPGAVKGIVTDELARFPRAGEIDQLRKEFAEPRGLNPRGRWQVGETYNKLDLVSYNGDSYVSNTDGNREKPSRSSEAWTLSAARGNGGGGGGATSLTDLVPVPANGELLIGNGSAFVNNTLTAGTGVTITNGPGSITIDASGAQELLTATVTNAESFAITRGQVVYLFGATGNRASVKLADNSSDAASSKTFGVVSDASIAANGVGLITCMGVVDGLSLGAYSAGDVLYLGNTPGTVTVTKPYAPNHLVYVGMVERANNGNGELYVRIQNGYELDEIHDVQITSAPLAGSLLMRDETNSLWKANRLTGTANQVTVTNADTAVTLSLPTAIANVNSVTAQSATNLTLAGGSTGASLVLGQGASGKAALSMSAATSLGTLRNSSASGYSAWEFLDNSGSSKGFLGYSNASTGYVASTMFLATVGSTELTFAIGANEAARISPLRNLLIGTTTDTTRLTVKPGTNTYQLSLLQSNTDAAGWGMWADTSGNLNVTRYGSSAFGTPALVFSASGNATLGAGLTFSAPAILATSTTPSTGVGTGALQVAGGIYAGGNSVIGSGSSSPNLTINGGTGTGTGASFAFQTSGSYIGAMGRAAVIDGGSGSDFQIQSQGGVNMRIGANGAQNLYLQTNNTARVTIAANTGDATFAGAVTVSSTTPSTTTSSGALVIGNGTSGGLGVGGALNVGGTGTFGGQVNISGSISPLLITTNTSASSYATQRVINSAGDILDTGIAGRSAGGVLQGYAYAYAFTQNGYRILTNNGTVAATFDNAQAATFAGTVIAPAATTALAPMRIPHGTAPTSPVNGDMWTTTAGLFVRINGVTVGPLS